MNKASNQISKVLLLLVIIPLTTTIVGGGLEYKAYEDEINADVFEVQKQELSEPVIDVNKLEAVDNLEEVQKADDIQKKQLSEDQVQEDQVTPTFVLEDAKDEDYVKTSQDKVLFGVENEQKDQTQAGEQELSVVTPKLKEGEVGTYVLTQDGSLEEEQTEENVVNKIQVEDNKIISADAGIVSTVGGVDKVIYAYSSIEDANNKVNGIPLSGGAFDAEYIATLESNGKYYVQMMISGFEGFIDLEDVQIIPTSLVKSQSHYENVDGNWVYFEATDPLKEDSYLTYEVSDAPEWSREGEAYISYDDENFEPLSSKTVSPDSHFEVLEPGDGGNTGSGNNGDGDGDGGGNTNTTSYSYFENLPFTSTSSYTGSQYKSYLKHKGYTNSQYYNSTNAFVETQEKENVNSLYLFAMANHESLYGTSEYAKTCNNFFGYGAFDSNPDNACGKYGYSTPRDGILAQGIHLTQQWGDLTDDFRWAGTELGNKEHGVNVTYASDSNWGKKIASHMRDIDGYLNHGEEGYYKIYEIKSEQDVYKSYSKNEKLKIVTVDGKEQNYRLSRDKGNPRVLVTGTNSDYFHFQLPTPINNSSSTTCKWTDANNGSYPNYDKTYSVKVAKGKASFACDYGSWTSQQAWYPKYTSSGAKTYNVISNASSHNPWVGKEESKLTYKTTWTDDRHKVTKGYDEDNNLVQLKKYTYTSKGGKETDYVNECYNTSGKRTYYRHIIHESDGSTKYDNKTTYTSSGIKTNVYKKDYDSKGNLLQIRDYKYSTSTKREIDYLNETFNTSGKRTYYRHIIHESDGSIKYDNKTTYTSSGKRIQITKKYYDSNGKHTKTEVI